MARIIDGERQNIVGENVKRARKQAKLSQKKLAELLETVPVYICRGSISRIESGERTVTDIEIAGLAQILKVSIAFLFGEDDRESQPKNRADSPNREPALSLFIQINPTATYFTTPASEIRSFYRM